MTRLREVPAWRRIPRCARGLLNCALLLAAVGAGRPAHAQQTGTGVGTTGAAQAAAADTVRRTPQEEALHRLRALGPLIRPDTLKRDTLAPGDTTLIPPPPPEVRFEGQGQGQGRQRGADERSGIAYDSIMQRLLALPGYTATEYTGGRAWFDTDSARLELQQNAVVVRDGQKLTADSSLIYWERRALTCGYGSPVFSGRGIDAPVQSDSLCYDLDRGYGLALGAETTVSEGALWRVRGDVYFDPRSGSAYAHDAIFTDCDEPFPHVHYHFAAKRLKVSPNDVLVARDVTLSFGDVPVFWLPYMVQSLARGRRSGLLMPRFGINDIARNSPRYNRKIEDIGVYWAINDFMGSELAMDWFAENYTALRGSLDYNWEQRFLRGGVTYRHFWGTEGGSNYTIATQNSWQPDERTRVGLNANYATSSAFVRRQTFDPRELNRTIDSNAGIQRRFDWGSVNTELARRQHLEDNRVDLTLPSLSVNLSSITLFDALPGEERWFSNATWTGSARTRTDRTSLGAGNLNPTVQDRRQTQGDVSSSFSLGRLSWSQNFRFDDQVRDERAFTLGVDSTVFLPRRAAQRTDWTTSLSFQQRLIGTSTITPNLSLRGGSLQADTTAGETVMAPVRMDFGASLRTDLFGFWPGVGPFELLRHRVSPSFGYSYSPTPTITDRQREVFAVGDIREQNRITIGVNQTFEARYRPRSAAPAPARGGPEAGAPGPVGAPGQVPGGAVGAMTDDALAEPDTSTGPRRREQAERISLLSITTDAVVYDFVAARDDGFGVQTTEIGNSLQSDLLRGLQVSFAHDLFRPVLTEDGTVVRGERSFAPHLNRVSAGFSLNNESWLFRALGLGGGGRDEPRSGVGGQRQPMDGDPDAGPIIDGTETEHGMIGTRRRTSLSGAPSRPVGSWNANFNYTMLRPRDTAVGGRESQMLMANVAFQPTPMWSMTWNTGYSFTTSEFTNHVLTMSRRLHDWDANFDFIRAQNGNFSFMFRVHLRANPDVKLDYTQQQRQTGQFPQF